MTFVFNPMGDSMITGICERKSLLKRPDQSGHVIQYVKTMKEQVMAANFDYAFIVTSLNDNYNYNRIARYVSITLEGNGVPVVILTKSDLVNDPTLFIREIEALSDKVRVHAISALKGIGLSELSPYMEAGNTLVLLGSSGVGKSTLVNALVGEEVMKTSEIREDDSKGRHTTTCRQMIFLPTGAVMIDMPGMRELGMCDVESGIDETFSDIKELEEQCRFRDCRHEKEPGCAIRQALDSGQITWERFKLYKNLKGESRASKDMKAIARKRRQLNSVKRKR